MRTAKISQCKNGWYLGEIHDTEHITAGNPKGWIASISDDTAFKILAVFSEHNVLKENVIIST